MPQEKLVNYDTRYESARDLSDVDVLSIKAEAEGQNPNTVISIVNLNDSGKIIHRNSIPTEVGELCITMKNTLKDIDYEINDRGELIIHAEDADNYSIDPETGSLIYTYR